MSDSDFWHAKWRSHDTPFHKASVHPQLVQHFAAWAPGAGERVFVPLCGKSADMAWLRVRGHPVLGVELSEIACRDFFREQGFAWSESVCGAFTRFQGDDLTLLAGDVFALTRKSLGVVHAVYDRAALVALPPQMRERYAQALCALLPETARMLVITLDYPQQRMNGPPFAVGNDELARHYGARFHITALHEHDVIDEEPHFRDRGLEALVERVHLLSPRRP